MGKESLYHPVHIGSLQVEGNLFLAPLAGYTDRAFRSICLEHGCSLTFSEMVSAEGIARDNEMTKQLMERGEHENLFAIQVFMHDASVLERAIPILMQYKPSLIDINCGCPVPKVVKTGAGSALLHYPEKIFEMVTLLRSLTDVPISVKIRLGWDANSINYQETTDAILRGGAHMITMHARTRSMGYSGTADWESLADLKLWVEKQSPSTVVCGSGDLFTAEKAKQMLLETGVDGVMFARGAMGNPFIFTQTRALLEGKEEQIEISLEARISVMKKHLALMISYIGEKSACKEMRKHAVAYLKGIPYASKAKQSMVHSSTYAEYDTVFQELIASSDRVTES